MTFKLAASLVFFLSFSSSPVRASKVSCPQLLDQKGNFYSRDISPVITGIGTSLGSEKVSIEEIAERLGTTDVRAIKRRTGTNTLHRFAADETVEIVAERAARQALAQASVSPGELTAIFASIASPTSDFQMPGVARILGERLGVGEINMTTLSLGCCGGMDALLTARNQVMLDTLMDRPSTILVVAADQTTRSLNPTDRASAFLFSEGAGAIIVTNRTRANGYAMERANAVCAKGDVFCMNIPNPSSNPPKAGFSMNGEAVLTFVVQEVAPRVGPLLGWDALPENALIIPHQASIVGLRQLEARLEREVYKETIGSVGNTTGSSFIFAFHDAFKSGRLVDRDIILLAFGAELKIAGAHLVPRGEGLPLIPQD